MGLAGLDEGVPRRISKPAFLVRVGVDSPPSPGGGTSDPVAAQHQWSPAVALTRTTLTRTTPGDSLETSTLGTSLVAQGVRH